jgi:large subunit ribosomal protein L2
MLLPSQNPNGIDHLGSKHGGRISFGRVTVRHRALGIENYPIVDYKREKRNIPAVVAAIEYILTAQRDCVAELCGREKKKYCCPIDLKVGEK